MKIETKFNVGDKIFFISPATTRVLDTIVRGFKIDCLDDVFDITYLCLNGEYNKTLVHLKVKESKAFKTKQDLLDSL